MAIQCLNPKPLTMTQSKKIDTCKCPREFQRKRTLDEYPMEHSREATQRMFQERRSNLATQRQTFASTTGESKKLISYSRKRFETALTIKDDESLPPPSPHDTKLFWEDTHPPWTGSYKRHVSLSASPVSQPVQLSYRPCSGPPLGKNVSSHTPAPINGKQRIFNHLRGNNREYPVIRRRLQESNATYRLVCPPAGTPGCDRCNRPTVDCIRKDDFIFVPRNEDPILGSSKKGKKIDDVYLSEHKDEEELKETKRKTLLKDEIESIEEEKDEEFGVKTEHLSEMVLNGTKSGSHEIAVEGLALEMNKKSKKSESVIKEKNTANIKQQKAQTQQVSSKPRPSDEKWEEPNKKEEEQQQEEDDTPASPWHCWVDDATVSSVHSNKSDTELYLGDNAPDTQIITDSAEPGLRHDSSDQMKVLISTVKLNDRKSPPASASEKKSNQSLVRRSTKVKKKGSKLRQTPEQVEEIIELPPQTAPPVEIVDVIDVPPKPILPSYICPSSVDKSTEKEIKLWLERSTFSAANKMLPIF